MVPYDYSVSGYFTWYNTQKKKQESFEMVSVVRSNSGDTFTELTSIETAVLSDEKTMSAYASGAKFCQLNVTERGQTC